MLFRSEIEMMKGFLAELARHFKRIVYKCGNHESRYDRYMMRKAPELIGLPQFEMRAVLGVDEVGAEYVHANQVIHAGKLTILHGHEFGESVFSPVNPARGMFLRATDCTLSGHQHRTSQHNERTLQGRPIVCFSTGALCDLSPAYRPINKWDHGAALMSFDGKSEFEVQTFRVINGKAY